MSPDLLTQLAEYGTYCEERQGSVSADEVIGDVARLPEPTPSRSTRSDRGWLVAVGAAALTLLLVGGVAWIARSNPPVEPIDEPVVTTVPPDEQLGTVGVLGPGKWSVAATFAYGTVSEELLRSTVEELRSWPGVLEVALARDAPGWLELTGLDAAACGERGTEPPCGVGLVAVVATPQMGLTQVRLESEFGMVAIKATDVPVAFVDGYLAAVRRQPAPDLRFDVLSLGTEVPLEGPDGADSGNMCSVADCLVSVRVSDDGLIAQAGLVRYESGDGSFEVEIVGENGHGGTGFETTQFLIDGSGRGGVLATDGSAGDRAVYGLAGLPVDAAAVTLQLADGTPVWQRPVGGMVLLVDRPGTARERGWPAYRLTVLDADGGEIIHIENTPDGPTVTDLRVDPVKAGELQTTDIDAIGPVDVAGMTLTWTQEQWREDEAPFVGWDLVSTSSGLLGTDRQGQLWRSSDGADWNRASIDLEDISLADGQTHVLASGRRDDGSVALLRSEDGETWTDLDRSTLGTEAFQVVATTPSGLTLFSGSADAGFGAGVIAVIDGDRVTDVHSPPWDLDPEAMSFAFEIVEVGGTVVALRSTGQRGSSLAWQYLGNGTWSEAAQIPPSTAHARVGNTVLMFDHTNIRFGSNPIPGLSEWPLLASTDGINWIELDTRTAQDVHALQINAGDSYWVYGGHGGLGDEIGTESTTIWISRDGRYWEPVDTSFAPPSFVVVVGDVIILADGAHNSIGAYWIGTVREQ